MQDRMKHGDRKGRHYYTTARQATSRVCIVVATLAVAMLRGERRELYPEQTSLLEFAFKMKQAEAYARFDGAKRNFTCLGHLSLGPSLKVGKFNQRSLLREQLHQTLSHQ